MNDRKRKKYNSKKKRVTTAEYMDYQIGLRQRRITMLKEENKDLTEKLERAGEAMIQFGKIIDSILYEVVKAYGKDNMIEIQLPDTKNAEKVKTEKDEEKKLYRVTASE